MSADVGKGNSNICREDGMKSKLMDPFMDWSFKYLFGREENKGNLIGFLNLLLRPEAPIIDLEFMNNESVPEEEGLKGCVFDIICRNTSNEKFLVEMQKRPKSNFNERILYYTCSLITKMGRKGKEWNYADIKKVYSICLMNFKYGKNPKLRRDYSILDVADYELFSDKLNIIMLQLPCLESKSIESCSVGYEYLLYLLKQMNQGMKTIEQLKKEVEQTHLSQEIKDVFYNVLDTADVASLSERDRIKYEANLKFYTDTMSELKYERDTGREEGREEGRMLEKRDMASLLKAEGSSIEFIAKITGLSTDEIEKL